MYQPLQIEDLTDNQGHRWTRREILSLGVNGFEGKYGGNYRAAIDLFREVAKEGKLEEAKRLSKTSRRLFHTLDKTFSRLEGGWDEMFGELSGAGGTALLASRMRGDATREDFLRRVAMGWETPFGRNQLAWQREAHLLIAYSSKVTNFKARREVIVALSTLERLRPELPPLVVLYCARRFHHLRTVTKEWIG